jgi:fatty-acyl-CoA synthase
MDTTLIELLETTAGNGTAQLGMAETGELSSLSDLLGESRKMASALAERGVTPGSFVGLILQNDAWFMRSMLAVQYAGATPVPLALPFAFGGMEEYGRHLQRIASDCEMRHVLVGPQLKRVRTRLDGLLDGTELVAVEDLSLDGPELRIPMDPESLALLQYTSGSTAAPKGVRLTHSNVLAGLHAIRVASELGPTDVLGAWLPMFHDMGLFSVLSAITAGGTVWMWSPGGFIRRPAQWLTEFADHGCTLVAAPNFFFDHLVQAAGDLPEGGVDLSPWRLAYNGAEPVNARTVEQFQETFGRYGLRAETMYPVYGMAEATLAVTFPRCGERPTTLTVDREELGINHTVVPVPADAPEGRRTVAVGRPVPEMRVRIVAADETVQAENGVGEIHIAGPSVTTGYHKRPRSESHTDDGWLATGDLGFLRDGQLYVVGRIKDVVIVHGTNYYAEDAEALVRDVPGVYRKRCAAVPATAANGAEQMALVAESSIDDPAEREALIRDLRARLSTGLGLPVEVHLVAPLALPQTSSGKIRRRQVRDRLATGVLVTLSSVETPTVVPAAG